MLRTASTPSSRSRRSAEAHILYAICRTEMSGRFFAVRVCAQAVHASAQSSIDNQLVKNLVEFRRRRGERKSNHFLRRHVRLRKYFSACKRARRPPKADGACAAVRPLTPLSKKEYFFDRQNSRHPHGMATVFVLAYLRFFFLFLSSASAASDRPVSRLVSPPPT